MTGADTSRRVLEVALDRDRRRVSSRARRREDVGAGVSSPEEMPRGISSAACISTSPRTEGRRGAVRVSRDLHDAAVGRGEGAAPAARPRAERIRGRRQQVAVAFAAAAGAARRRACPWLKAMVDAGEIYHPLRWTPAEALATADRHAPARSRRRHRARAGRVARQSSAAPAGHRDGRRQAAVGPRRRGAARLPHGRHPRRRAADRGRDRATARRVERPCTWCADAGSRSIAHSSGGCSTSSRRSRRPRRRTGSLSARRCGWSPARNVPGESSRPPQPDWSRVVAGPWLAKTLPAFAIPSQLAHARSRRRAEGDACGPISRSACAGCTCFHARPRRLPGRRHGSRQDHAGAGAAAGVASAAHDKEARRASLLVAPASLLANWAAEIERFAPTLTRDRSRIRRP